MALDAALAGLGIGRKFCRQLRAELRLEDVTRQGRCVEGCVILLIDMDDFRGMFAIGMYVICIC